MKSFLIVTAGLLVLLHSGLGCAPTIPTPPSAETTTPRTTTPKTKTTTPKDDSCAGALGLKELDKNGYKDGGPVEDAKKLNFDAGSPQKACWKNHKPKADELDFAKIADGKKLKKCGKAEPAPQGGPHIVAYSPDGAKGKALFHSCSVLCSDGPPKVTVTGSKSKNVNMQICLADSFTQPKLKDCKPVKFGKPVTIGKKKRPTIYDIVIKVDGLKRDTFAAIKKIKVDFKKCKDKPNDAGAPCNAACEFDKGTCGFKKDATNAGATELKAYEQKTIVGNLDSGVNARLDGNPAAAKPIVSDSSFMAAPQNPGDKVVSSATVNVKKDLEMTFDVYEACDGNAAKVCFDTPTNCPYTSNPSVAAADREWKMEKVRVPKGTKKIFLVGDNSQGQRFCASGFSHVNFQEPGKTKKLCPSKSASGKKPKGK